MLICLEHGILKYLEFGQLVKKANQDANERADMGDTVHTTFRQVQRKSALKKTIKIYL